MSVRTSTPSMIDMETTMGDRQPAQLKPTSRTRDGRVWCAGWKGWMYTVVLYAVIAGAIAAQPPSTQSLSTVPSTAVLFTEDATATGLDFVHFNGMTGAFYFPETTGSGGALFDYDNDGDLDLYVVQGALLGPKAKMADAILPPHHPLPLVDRLYRNDLTVGPDGTVSLRFTDVTAEIGVAARGYGLGVATGDYDSDGWVDLYVTNFGPNLLLHNNGDGTFSDVTEKTGTQDTRWGSAASFLDYDGDGWLDLYVANYLEFSFSTHLQCFSPSGAREYCNPSAYQAVPGRLFRNRGDGTFEDASGRSGINKVYGGALGLATADFNGDGRVDVYVANDGRPNQLWINQGDGTFVDDALLAGSALNWQGQAEAGMGVDAADFDGDGDEDLFVAHLTGESNTLYVNDGSGLFRDRSPTANLATPSWSYTSFGAGWLDYDNDGWLDLLVASGAVKTIEALARAGDPYPFHQQNQLFRSRGDGTFEETTAIAGAALALSEVSRGVAFGDVDNDGDTDAVVINAAGPVRLLRNQVGHERPWLGLRLLTKDGGRDALGARVVVERAGRPPLWRRVHTDGSYASASDPRILIGLGDQPRFDRVRVHWPSGRIEIWMDLPVGRYSTLREGSGASPKDE